MPPGEGAKALAGTSTDWPESPGTTQPLSVPPCDVPSQHGRSASWVPWLVPTVLMATLGTAGVGRPGLWGDEFATWGAVRLPAPELSQLLRVVDAVLAPYYVAMGAWIRVVGSSDVALRLPSVAAMTAAAGLVGALGTRLASPRAGLTSGVLFAGLPVVSRYAQEARPYAFVVLFAVLATWLLLRLVERPQLPRLVAYAVAVALLGLCNLVALLILIAHAALVIHSRPVQLPPPDSPLPSTPPRDRWRLVLTWLAAALAGALPALPLAVVGFSQKAQVNWVSSFNLSPLAYLMLLGGSLLGGVLVCVLMVLSRPRRSVGWLLTSWALLPPLVLLALTPVVNLLLPRYLLFILPAWILLAGIGLSQHATKWTVVVLVVITVCAVPLHWTLRSAGGHESQATRELANTITSYYQPGDGIVYSQKDGLTICCTWLARDVLAHYVPADRRPRDLFLRWPQRTDGRMEAVEYHDPLFRIGRTARIWVVRLRYPSDPLSGLGDGKEQILRQQYRRAWVWYPLGFTVALYTRVGWPSPAAPG